MGPHAEVRVPGDGIPTQVSSPAVTKSQNGYLTNDHVVEPATTVPVHENDYLYTFDNRDGSSPLEVKPDASYKVAEHILWAPRRVRVASIGAGASGIMFCYKKEKEFGDSIDLVVYDSIVTLHSSPSH
jgi:hypothetical protein